MAAAAAAVLGHTRVPAGAARARPHARGKTAGPGLDAPGACLEHALQPYLVAGNDHQRTRAAHGHGAALDAEILDVQHGQLGAERLLGPDIEHDGGLGAVGMAQIVHGEAGGVDDGAVPQDHAPGAGKRSCGRDVSDAALGSGLSGVTCRGAGIPGRGSGRASTSCSPGSEPHALGARHGNASSSRRAARRCRAAWIPGTGSRRMEAEHYLIRPCRQIPVCDSV
jgi:hypothetical protein